MPHCFSWWMNGISHRALFLFQGFSREKSKQTLSLVTLFFMAQPLLLTPEDLTRPSWHSLFSLCSKSSYCQCQTAEVPQRAPPSYSTTETALTPLSPDSKQTGAVDSSPSWSNTKKSPCQPSTHTTSLLVQAVTTCEAFPQAEHMDLIKCRSLTMISWPNSPNRLCLNPLLHLLLLPLQPEQCCFPTCMFFFHI